MCYIALDYYSGLYQFIAGPVKDLTGKSARASNIRKLLPITSSKCKHNFLNVGITNSTFS